VAAPSGCGARGRLQGRRPAGRARSHSVAIAGAVIGTLDWDRELVFPVTNRGKPGPAPIGGGLNASNSAVACRDSHTRRCTCKAAREANWRDSPANYHVIIISRLPNGSPRPANITRSGSDQPYGNARMLSVSVRKDVLDFAHVSGPKNLTR
jgi:hypothetical protein